MDPLSIGVGIVGIGLSLFGGSKAADDAAKAAQISKNIAGDEQQINAQKQQQMQMEAQRNSLQQYRNAQRLRAQATASAVNQGANFGSGLQGGLAEVTNEADYNVQGIQNNLQFGNTIFGINSDISQQKMQLADVQASSASDTALMSLGGALVSNAGTIGKLGSNLAGGFGSAGNSFFGGGSPSGYGK